MNDLEFNWKETSLEEIKTIQLDLLFTIKEFCEKNEIKFFLMYGTLLGAVRHKGYIPWDDDIDIAMLRNDYDKFVSKFNNEQNRYIVKERRVDSKFPYYFAKICDPQTRLEEQIDGKAYNLGINIDLFPLDNVPSDPKQKEKMWKAIQLRKKRILINTIDKKSKRSWYKRLILWLAIKFLSGTTTVEHCNRLQKIVMKYSNLPSEEVVEIMTPYGKKSIIKREYFENIIMNDFEKCSMPIPRDYDNILTQLYGDYMIPPPREKQVSHHTYNAYVRKKNYKL